VKILHIYKNYYPILGGIENHIKLVCEELAQQPGYETQVVVTNGNFSTQRASINGVEVIKCGRLFELASTPVSFSMYWHLKSLKPDIVHFHFPYPPGELFGWLNYRNSSTKFVMTYHSDVVRQSGVMRLYYPIFKRILKRVNTVIASNPNNLRSSEILKEIHPEKIKIVPYGIRLEDLQRPQSNGIESVRKSYGNRIVVFVGKLRYYKGLKYLIRAAQTVEARFLIIGDGPLRVQLGRLVEELKLQKKVTFLGEIDNQSLVNYLYASEVFVLPSIFRSEAFGISILEAMACGLPVISTELGTGTSFVNLHQKTGLVIKPADANALADALNILLSDSALRMTLGQNAKQRVENLFNYNIMLNKIREIYHS
jgi:rhamnosyl/mannosyltransferase